MCVVNILNTEREEAVCSCREAIDQLHRASHVMMHFGESLDSFVQYWNRLEVMLDIVKERIHELRGSKFLRLRLGMIIESWEAVSKSLLDYAVKVCSLSAV
jgi:hypothetical protein